MIKKRTLTITIILITLLASIIACNAPGAAPTQDIAVIVAQTQTAVVLERFLSTTAAPESIPPTSLAAAPTQTTQSTNTPSPTSTPTAPTCQDKAKFEGETIPDKTLFAPGEQFVKSWILRNTGTCTWTPEYALVFDSGEQMDGTSPSPIGATVAPDQTVTLLLPQTAPSEPGHHEGYWKLLNLQGKKFGIGNGADTAFWVKIEVSPDAGSSSTVSGPPTWEENFDNGTKYWYLGINEKIDYAVEDDRLVITAQELVGDRWRVSELGSLSDFYLEATFTTGKTCSRKDAYGFIFRAPSQPDNIIDTGYVYSISCDGTYRFYRMDSGNYVGLINWTPHTTIRSGANQTNVIGVKAVGSSIQFYANGKLLAEIEDDLYPSGLFGFMLRADSTPEFQVAVDRIAYWNLVR